MLEKLTPKEQEEIQNARLLYYDFFYGLFVFELLESRMNLAIKQLEILLNAPLSPKAETAMYSLKDALQENGKTGIKEEFTRLFALPFGGVQVGMHLSHYYEQCIGAESLLKMRALLKKSDVRVETKEFKESEEHLGFLFGFMRHLIQSNQKALEEEVFNFIIEAYDGLIQEIYAREDAKIYRALADILESFIEFEKEIHG